MNPIVLGMLCGAAAGAAHCQEQKIPALEAFKTCNLAAMPKAPVTLPNGLVIKKVSVTDPGFGKRMQLTFNKRADPNKENQAGLVKRLTGYDFTDMDRFEIDEAGGAPWIACIAKN